MRPSIRICRSYIVCHYGEELWSVSELDDQWGARITNLTEEHDSIELAAGPGVLRGIAEQLLIIAEHCEDAINARLDAEGEQNAKTADQ